MTIRFSVNPSVRNDELDALFGATWSGHTPRDFSPVLARSLGYVCAFSEDQLIGFVNVAWDGDKHAFLLDPTVRPDHQRLGIGMELVRQSTELARSKGAEWLHVDYEPRLAEFYRRCGFGETVAGLLHLKDRKSVGRDASRDGFRAKDLQFLDCGAELRPKVLESWKWLTDKYLHLDDGFSIVALDGEMPVGVIAVYPRRLPPPLYETQEGYIDLIDVLAPYRKCGVARRLVEISIARCRGKGLCQVRAWSSEDKVEAIPMWKALGFGLCPTTEYPRGQTVKGYFVTYQL